jgi:hypothetical protein
MNFAKVGAEMSGEMRFPQQEQQVVHSSSESQRERERETETRRHKLGPSDSSSFFHTVPPEFIFKSSL